MIYLLILAMIILFSIFFNPNKNKKNKKIFILLSFGLMFIIAALRKYTVGIDLEIIYTPTFSTILITPFQNLEKVGIEYGFAVFLKIISLFSNDIQLFIFISSAIIYFSFGRFFYKYSNNCVISTLAFYLSCNYFMSMNVIRQFLAISIILFAFEFYNKKKYALYIIIIWMASLFHSSSIIFFVLPLIKKIKVNKNFFVKLFLLATLLYIGITPIINIFSNLMDIIGMNSNKLYNIYLLNTKYGGKNLSILNISDVIIGILIVVIGYYGYLLALRDKNTYFEKFHVNSLILSSFYFLFTLLSMKISITSRVSLFFIPFLYLTLADSFMIQKNKLNKLICYYILFGIFGIKWFYILMNSAGKLFGVMPYTFFWN